ncbi:MAG: SDR family oxidoreductase [Pseudomonadota bacterium]|nr:SDR family oxidoreductase [Pseudomonadota bacterium]
MKLLVTGSEGYVGAALVPMLEAAGHRVTRVDSLLFDGCEVRPLPGRSRVRRQDFRSIPESDLEGFDGVVHLAALSNDPLSNLDPALTHEVNHREAALFAQKVRSAGVPRFVFSSTCSVYGRQGDEMIDESATPNPVTAYGVSKLRAEGDIAALATADFAPVSLRFGTAYGWSDMVRFDLVVNNLVASARLDGTLRLNSDGRAWRPMVHVGDMCAGFLAALEAPSGSVSGEVFNIGRTEDNWMIIDLAREISRLMGDCDIQMPADAVTDTRSYRVDCSKAAMGLPAFAPSWSVERGIAQVVAKVWDLDEARLRSLFQGRIAHLLALRDAGRLTPDLRLVPA